jgi:hypothetical protein
MDRRIGAEMKEEMKQMTRELRQFFRNRALLPGAYRKASPGAIAESIELILASDFCRNLLERRYRLGSGYTPWLTLAARMAARIWAPVPLLPKVMAELEASQDVTYLMALIYTYSFTFHHYPTYRVDENLLEFLRHTDLPKTFDFPPSIPLMLMILPQNRYLDEEGIPVDYMLVQQVFCTISNCLT